MQDLSDYQQSILLMNPNIETIKDKNVIYKSKFKIKAVEQYLKGKTSKEVFIDAGINPEFFIKRYCDSCLMRWKRKYFEEGKTSLKVSKTGKKSPGRPKLENPDELTTEELKALVKIQQDIIEMLKKNRALAKKKKVK